MFAKGQRILEGRDSLPKVLQENLKAGKNKLWGPSPALEQSPLPVLDPKQKAAFEQKQNLNKLQKIVPSVRRPSKAEPLKSRSNWRKDQSTGSIKVDPKHKLNDNGKP